MTLRIPPGTPVLTAQAMRDAEQACFDKGVAQGELMERAGAAVAQAALRFAMDRSILVLAGPGNNGGDAYVAARLLAERGHDVTVAALGGKRDGAAEEMRQRWTGNTVPLEQAEPRAVLIDGLFGTGMSRPIEGAVKAALHRLVAAAQFSLAIDLPSGLDTDSGGDMGAARVDVTVALGSLKPAHLLGYGLERCGHVLLADIGIPISPEVVKLARPRLTPPAPDAHKYSRGMVVVVEGEMPGASRLAARAALHGGAGYVLLAGTGSADAGPDALVHARVDDAKALHDLLDDARVGAVVIGPGLGRSEAARAKLEAVLAAPHPTVFDGDALTLLGEGATQCFAKRDAVSILTPHAGEFARMFGKNGRGKIERTRDAAADCGAVIVHKGPDTVIGGLTQLTVANAGTAWLSTAGTGDILAGLVGARLAVEGRCGVCHAVWLHGRAAELAGAAFAADRLIRHIPQAIEECL
ncbi:NAD(P)H-hydrate dehydratase [Stakelama sp. CBK3Z-3]|uniref:Bifunctional NAD(P)H-hydrate repair enzyme n=1 Tax=Stakelama flava TaxID=2860338 RepID=A0ABS6XRL7_9SPHN|nr:NAD(P)H-hydrate dehydratase [Stakelama flava]MBW4332056.1 NAD(P)H-hydrate dehydratase [Stakelama flava]